MTTRRRRTIWVAGSLVVAAGLGGGVSTLLVRYHAFAQRSTHHGAIASLEFSADGSRLLSVSRDEKRFLVWEVTNPLDMKYGARMSGVAYRAVLAPAGDVVVLTREKDKPRRAFDKVTVPIFIVQLATKSETRSELDTLTGFQFSPDGKCFGIMWECVESHDGVMGTCNSPIRQKKGFGPATVPLSLDFTRDSRWLVVGGAHELTLMTNSPGIVVTARAPSVKAVPHTDVASIVSDDVQFACVKSSWDGHTIYGGGDARLTAWDSQKLATRWTTNAHVECLDEVRGQGLVIALGGHQFQVFEGFDGTRRGTWPTTSETCFALSPDGRSIALGHSDGRVELRPLESFLPGLH